MKEDSSNVMTENKFFIYLFVCLFVCFIYLPMQHPHCLLHHSVPWVFFLPLCGNSLCLVRWWSKMSCLFVCLLSLTNTLSTLFIASFLNSFLFCCILWGVADRKCIYVSLPVKRIATFIMTYTIYLVAKQQTTMYNRLHIAVECQVYSKYTCVHESVMCGLASSRQCLQSGFKYN